MMRFTSHSHLIAAAPATPLTRVVRYTRYTPSVLADMINSFFCNIDS